MNAIGNPRMRPGVNNFERNQNRYVTEEDNSHFTSDTFHHFLAYATTGLDGLHCSLFQKEVEQREFELKMIESVMETCQQRIGFIKRTKDVKENDLLVMFPPFHFELLPPGLDMGEIQLFYETLVRLKLVQDFQMIPLDKYFPQGMLSKLFDALPHHSECSFTTTARNVRRLLTFGWLEFVKAEPRDLYTDVT
jgi:hypothetical protein